MPLGQRHPAGCAVLQSDDKAQDAGLPTMGTKSQLECTHHGIALTLGASEKLMRPCPDMFNDPQRSITARNRTVLVDWLLDVAQEFALRGDTLFLAVDLLDRHLSCTDESTAWLQLLGSACMWTAAKVEEMYAPSAQDMISLTENIYTAGQLVQMERHLLLALQHSVVRPNTYTFLSTLLHISHAEELYGSPPHSTPATCPMCYWETCELQATTTAATGSTLAAPARNSARSSLASYASCSTHACAVTFCLDPSSRCSSVGPEDLEPSNPSLPQHAATRNPAANGSIWSQLSGLPAKPAPQESTQVLQWLLHTNAGPTQALTGSHATAAASSNTAELTGTGSQSPLAGWRTSTHPFLADDDNENEAGAGADGLGWLRDEDNDGVKCDREAQAHMQLVYLARLVAEACLLDHKLLHFLPSQVSAACLMVARTMLGKAPWSPALAQHAEVDGPHALAACVVAVADAYARARQDTDLSSLQARYGFRRMNVFALEPSAAALELVASCRAVAAMAQPCAASTNVTTSRSVTPSIPTPGYTSAYARAESGVIMKDAWQDDSDLPCNDGSEASFGIASALDTHMFKSTAGLVSQLARCGLEEDSEVPDHECKAARKVPSGSLKVEVSDWSFHCTDGFLDSAVLPASSKPAGSKRARVTSKLPTPRYSCLDGDDMPGFGDDLLMAGCSPRSALASELGSWGASTATTGCSIDSNLSLMFGLGKLVDVSGQVHSISIPENCWFHPGPAPSRRA